jgi:pyruvate/2-oxoglutarate dehydrogenase complex dihydrolipoamide dehydrogenase (E3) component
VDERVDAIVVGMGPGGEDLAGRLAQAGLDVVGIDERLLGGECPYFACVPTKMMLRAAGLVADARRVAGIAGTATVSSDWTPVARRIRDEATDNWDDRAAVERFEGKGGRFTRGSAHFEGPDRVAVGDSVFTARKAIVINTGTSPAIPPIDGLSDVAYWTNRDAVRLTQVPESLALLGGGPTGVELAQTFGRFGTGVTLIEQAEHLLDGSEPEVSTVLEDVFRREGIDVRLGAGAKSISARDGGIVIRLDNGASVSAQHLLVAVGREPNLASLQLARAGLDEHARFIDVDDHMRAAPGIWAIGDITGKGAFTHISMYQAAIARADILGEKGPAADYRAVPRIAFTDPEVGSVGLTERQALDRGLNVRTGIAQVPKSARGWIHKAGNDGVIKLVEDADRGVLVGGTSVGPAGGEVLSMLTLAVHAEVTVQTLRTVIKGYPTFHGGIDDALDALLE